MALSKRCCIAMSSALLMTCVFAILTLRATLPQTRPQLLHTSDKLRFTKEGTFQIGIFEDLHFGENAWEYWGPQQDLNSVKVMDAVLDAESQQQLVVFNGDLITGENTYLSNSTSYIDQIVAPLVRRGIPWASTYGNHDSAFNLSRDLILEQERKWPNARTTQMVVGRSAGVSNYYLPVYPSDGIDEPSLLLWFFDSRGGHHFQEVGPSGDNGQPNWVDQTVVDWFKDTHLALSKKYKHTIASLAFVHIPTNASLALQLEAGVDGHLQPGINDDFPLAQQSQGWCSDGSSDLACPYGGHDGPFMEALTTTPGLIALFSGHDHGDTWCYKWDKLLPGMAVEGHGLNMCFGQHSGYGGYGDWIRGARQVLVSKKMLEQGAIETWIRLEDQAIVGHVVLNATYNHDWYPATNDSRTHCPTCTYD